MQQMDQRNKESKTSSNKLSYDMVFCQGKLILFSLFLEQEEIKYTRTLNKDKTRQIAVLFISYDIYGTTDKNITPRPATLSFLLIAILEHNYFFIDKH